MKTPSVPHRVEGVFHVCYSLNRYVVKICVSDIRQSQVWRYESGAIWWLNSLTPPFLRARGGMRAACGVNAAPGAGEP